MAATVIRLGEDVGEVKLIRPPDPPGELKYYIQVIDGRIIIDYGITIQWLAITPEAADKLADELRDAARIARTLHLSQGGDDGD